MDFISGLFGASFLWCTLLIIGLVALFFWPSDKERGESTWDILNRKFAEGALSTEEYEQRRAVLEQNKVKK